MGEGEGEAGKPGGLGPQEGALLAPPTSPLPTPRRAPSAESRGPDGEGAGWPERLARPWGQREGPAPLGSPPCPCPPLPRPRAGNVLFPPLPPRGQRAGRAGWLLPCSPPSQVRAAAAAGPPLTHAAPGLARRGLGDGVRGGGRTGAPWRPLGRAAGAPLGSAAQARPPTAPWVPERNPPPSLRTEYTPVLYIASSVGLVEI